MPSSLVCDSKSFINNRIIGLNSKVLLFVCLNTLMAAWPFEEYWTSATRGIVPCCLFHLIDAFNLFLLIYLRCGSNIASLINGFGWAQTETVLSCCWENWRFCCDTGRILMLLCFSFVIVLINGIYHETDEPLHLLRKNTGWYYYFYPSRFVSELTVQNYLRLFLFSKEL